jgi:hypothetical protein
MQNIRVTAGLLGEAACLALTRQYKLTIGG